MNVTGWSRGGSDAAPDVIDLFMDSAARRPEATAVSCDGEQVSYGALERLVRVLAAEFATRPAPCVLVALPQGAMAYAAMLAAALAGGYYVPVSVSAPPAKLRDICRQAQPDVVIATRPLLDALCHAAPGAIRLDADAVAMPDGALDGQPVLAGRGTRHALAYMIFTSGSTGTPKGVVIPRPALEHYIRWTGNGLGIGPDDRVSQYANIAFDLSVVEIYGALCHGASLHPPSGQGDRLMPARMIEREGLTFWISVPSVVGLMIQARQLTGARLATLRRMLFCGEPLLEHQVAAIFQARPDLVIQNTYGPTEATVSMTSVQLTRDTYHRHSLGSMSIGEPIEGMELRLEGGPSPDEGEIVIAGPQLAAGYLGAPDRTAWSFPDGPDGRCYRTGDWAERRDGRLYHRGRIDFQVKVRGYRIELDEVCVAIAGCGYPNACVFKHEEQLVAVVETGDEAGFDEAALRRRLAGLVDAYAVPGIVQPIPLLPRNASDKIDRASVMAWFQARLEENDTAEQRTAA